MTGVIDPAGFGMPDATTSGVPAGITLTPYTGPMTITTPGTVINGAIIDGTLTVKAANVTIENCVVQNYGFWGIDASDPAAMGNVTIQNCTMTASSTSSTNAAIAGAGTFIGNNISNSENGIVTTDGGPTIVENNYIHDLRSIAADPHLDGISVQGNENGVLIEHNTVAGWDTSDVFIKNDFGPINDITVTDNLLFEDPVRGDPAYTIYVYGPDTTNVTITDNYVAKGIWGYYSISNANPTISGDIEWDNNTNPIPYPNSPPPPPPPSSSPSPPTNLVVNGGFETGDFTGWTTSGNVAQLSYGPQLLITSSAHSGQDAAGFGSVGSDGTISQDLTTVVGQSYTLDFWLANAAGGPNDFTAKIGSVTELHLVNAAAQPYTHYDFTFTATSTSTPLEFDFRQDPSEWHLDDVSVVQATGSALPPPAPTPPAAPVIAAFSPDTASFSPDTAPVGDGHTPATSITLTGTGETNSTVNVFDGTTSVGQASVNASGAWSLLDSSLLDSGLAVGPHSFTATDTDANGTSAASAVFAVTVDAPTAPPPPSSSPPPPTNLVVNGSFETGDFAGWTTSGNVAQLSIGPQLFTTSTAHSGQDAAGFGSVGSDGTISQNLTTVVGQSYTLDFWLGNAAGGPNDFTAKISGVTELHLVNAAAQPYTHYDFTFTATSTSTPLEFDFRQDPSEWHLDDVSVVQATGSALPPPAPTPPAAPVIAAFSPDTASFSPDTAPVGDGHTPATSITLTGTGETNSTVNVFDGTTSVGQASVNASGAWSLLDSGLAVGPHSFTATDTDANGTSAASAVFAVTVDAPTAPPPPPSSPPAPVITSFSPDTGGVSFIIGSGDSVELGSAYSGSVTFAGATGTLRLDDPASFAGTVAGMTGQDTIDFANIDPAKVQPPSYTGDASGGTLNVTDGTHAGNIALLGNYMASVFVPSSDGHGGTSVVDPPALGGVQPLVTPPHA